MKGMNISDTIPVYGPINYPTLSYFDQSNIVLQLNSEHINLFPVNMMMANKQYGMESTERLLGHLEDGKTLIAGSGYDWLLIIILFSAFAYGILRSFFGGRLFGNINTSTAHRSMETAHDTSVLFHWNAIFLHFISFLNLSIFSYCAFSYYDIVPEKINGPLFLVIGTAFWALAALFRHIICSIVGFISGYKVLFNDYLLSVYNTYKVLALVLFIISILILYTSFIPVKILIYIALTAVVVLMFFRFFGLLTAFIKSNISILYLILYLCALEILPVAVVVKYIQRLL